MTQKHFISVITTPNGTFTNVPQGMKDINNVVINFNIESLNTINVTAIFDDTTLSQSAAMQYSLEKIESLALDIALKNTLNVSWSANYKSLWPTEEGKEQLSHQLLVI